MINSINVDLDKLCKYFCENIMVINAKKPEFMIISTKNVGSIFDDVNIMINCTCLQK